jgi:hypothetical protein
MTVRIAYPDAMSMQVVKDGKTIDMNDWDDVLENYGPITQTTCGENRFIAIQNILEFYISANCELIIKPRDAIQTKVRMEWTLDDFYAEGGTTKLIDRISASLGIHASSIKVVGVYEGSLIIDYNIYTTGDSIMELDMIKATQTDLIATNHNYLGAPILDFEQNTEPVVSDGVVSAAGYEPIVLSITITNADAAPETIKDTQKQFEQEDSASEDGTFSPDIEIIESPYVQEKKAEVSLAEGSDYSVLVIVSFSCVLIFLLACAIKLFLNILKKQAIDAQAIQRVKKNFDNQIKPNDFLELPNSKNGPASNRSTDHSQQFNTQTKMVEEYASQYDANHDFAIFGTGDKAQGGMQSLAMKMNMADENMSTADNISKVGGKKSPNESLPEG